MPHKRAKRSLREQSRSQRGTDHAPTSALDSEPLPKSAARILNAASIRAEWRSKKRSADGEDGDGSRKKKKRKTEKETAMGIQPGETLAHFNKRVESDMAPLMKSAMASSSAHTRKVRNTEVEARAKSRSKPPPPEPEPHPEPPPPAPTQRAVEFAKTSTSAPRRLNDIAQAPPTMTRLPRGVKSGPAGGTEGGGRGVLSMAQRAMMEAERERAIQRYREMKEARRRSGAES